MTERNGGGDATPTEHGRKDVLEAERVAALAKLFENDTLKFAYNSAMVGIHFLQSHH